MATTKEYFAFPEYCSIGFGQENSPYEVPPPIPNPKPEAPNFFPTLVISNENPP